MKRILLFCLVLAGCGSPETELPYFDVASNAPVWSVDRGAVRRIGDFAFTDQTGALVDRETVSGRAFVAHFFFVECTDICPTLRSRLTAVTEVYGASQVAILSHSVAEKQDTVDKLAAYAQVNHIEPAQWRLLTGDPQTVLHLAQEVYGAEMRDYTAGAEQGSTFMHTETVFLVDGEGFVRGMYNGTLESEINLLIRDIDTLLSDGNA
jgi:protein SCO1/2